MTDAITVTVDSDIAERYHSASEPERRKLDLLVNSYLRDMMTRRKSLEETTAELSRKAQERGLTPEILQSVLDDRPSDASLRI